MCCAALSVTVEDQKPGGMVFLAGAAATSPLDAEKVVQLKGPDRGEAAGCGQKASHLGLLARLRLLANALEKYGETVRPSNSSPPSRGDAASAAARFAPTVSFEGGGFRLELDGRTKTLRVLRGQDVASLPLQSSKPADSPLFSALEAACAPPAGLEGTVASGGHRADARLVLRACLPAAAEAANAATTQAFRNDVLRSNVALPNAVPRRIADNVDEAVLKVDEALRQVYGLRRGLAEASVRMQAYEALSQTVFADFYNEWHRTAAPGVIMKYAGEVAFFIGPKGIRSEAGFQEADEDGMRLGQRWRLVIETPWRPRERRFGAPSATWKAEGGGSGGGGPQQRDAADPAKRGWWHRLRRAAAQTLAAKPPRKSGLVTGP